MVVIISMHGVRGSAYFVFVSVAACFSFWDGRMDTMREIMNTYLAMALVGQLR